jgi:hypothetical protein
MLMSEANDIYEQMANRNNIALNDTIKIGEDGSIQIELNWKMEMIDLNKEEFKYSNDFIEEPTNIKNWDLCKDFEDDKKRNTTTWLFGHVMVGFNNYTVGKLYKIDPSKTASFKIVTYERLKRDDEEVSRYITKTRYIEF